MKESTHKKERVRSELAIKHKRQYLFFAYNTQTREYSIRIGGSRSMMGGAKRRFFLIKKKQNLSILFRHFYPAAEAFKHSFISSIAQLNTNVLLSPAPRGIRKFYLFFYMFFDFKVLAQSYFWSPEKKIYIEKKTLSKLIEI